MGQAKFATGQGVTFAKPTIITPDAEYTVVRVFPGDAIDQRYAIKCTREPFERVVCEMDIRLCAEAPRAAQPEPAGVAKAS